MRRTFYLAMWLYIASVLCGCGTEFTDEDIVVCKQSIHDEYSKRDGVEVIEVVMMKESRKKLMGLLKLKVNFMGTDREITKSCTATMGETHQYIWQCE